MSAFRTIDELEAALQAADYLPDRGLSTALFLSLALEKIRVFLDSRPRSLSWNGMEPGLTGFHRVPTSLGFGSGFVRRLEALIDREVEQFAQEAIARGGPPPPRPT